MSTLIRNIGILDARKAQLDQIKELAKVENVGFLIVSPENKAEFLKISLENVGSTMELEGDYKLQTGQARITREMLESLDEKLRLCVAGQMNIDPDISQELFADKVEGLYIVGQAAVPEHLHGVFMNKAKGITGQVAVFKSTGKQIVGSIKITNEYLNGLSEPTDLSVVGAITLGEEIREELFLEKIASISVTGAVKCLDIQESMLRKVLKDSEVTKVKVIRSDFHYLASGSRLDAFMLMSIDKQTISCPGQLILDDDIDPDMLAGKDTTFDATNVYFPKPLIQQMLKRITTTSKGIPYESGKFEIFSGEQRLTQMRLESMADRCSWLVLGELSIDEGISIESLSAKLANLDNFGEIICTPNIASILQSKLRNNKGNIECEEPTNSEDDNKYDSIIENAGTYTL